MNNSTNLSILFCFFFSILRTIAFAEGPTEVENWFNNLNHAKPHEKMTKLHFYFHDLLKGKNVTASTVAKANMTATSPTDFGEFIFVDDPLTVGPELSSKRVGYMKGFYGTASFEEVALEMAMTFVFTDEVYNGSTLSVLGYNPDQHMYREIPVVGGSGLFRLARGVATLHNYFIDVVAGNATVEVHIVVLHY